MYGGDARSSEQSKTLCLSLTICSVWDKAEEAISAGCDTRQTYWSVLKLWTQYQQLQLSDSWRRRQNAWHGLRSGHLDIAGLHAKCLDHDLQCNGTTVYLRDSNEKTDEPSFNRFSRNRFNSDPWQNKKHLRPLQLRLPKALNAAWLYPKKQRQKDDDFYRD